MLYVDHSVESKKIKKKIIGSLEREKNVKCCFTFVVLLVPLTSTKLVPPLPHKLKKWVDGIQGVGLRGARDRAKERYQFSLQF